MTRPPEGQESAVINVRRLVEKVTSLPGFTSAAGIWVVSAERGTVHMALGRRPDLLQFNGYFHGGVIAGLADHAAGGAVTTALPSGRIAITVALNLSFLKPADGDLIIARAKAMHVGSTLCTATVEVATQPGSEERTCALATVTLRVVDMPKDSKNAAERGGSEAASAEGDS